MTLVTSAPAAIGSCRVDSEVGRLRRVLLHRPGAELERVVPDNYAEFLFDDIPWLPAAQREHDVFAEVLRSRGAEVLYTDRLLTSALRDDRVRTELIDRSLDASRIGPGLYHATREFLAERSPTELADVLIGGLCVDEVDVTSHTLVHSAGVAGQFLVEPLPNHMFTRDSLTCVGDRVSVNRFRCPAREREATNLRVVLGGRLPYVWPSPVAPAPIEGGDVLVVGAGAVLIGVGPRTTAAAAEFLAAQLLDQGLAHTVLAVCLPQSRQTMHLDTIMTMVSQDTLLASPGYLDRCRAFRLCLSPDGDIRARAVDNIVHEIARAIRVPAVRIVPTGRDHFDQYREQWSDAANVLAVEPGVVVAYDRNARANESLCRAGITVLTVPGAELSRGRGGPHCLSCPLEREEPG